MSKFVELVNGTLVNLDNVKTVKKNNAINGGKPSLIITYMDCTGQPMPFDDRRDMDCAFNVFKDSNDI